VLLLLPALLLLAQPLKWVGRATSHHVTWLEHEMPYEHLVASPNDCCD
jgi:hypothetical protein